MNCQLDIEISDLLDDVTCGVVSQMEELVENLRNHLPAPVTHRVDVDIEELLADHHAIAFVWDIEHIRDQRPDLTDGESWQVLQECQRGWERLNDPMLETIRQTATKLFPRPKGKAALRAYLAGIERRIEALPEDECADPAAYGSVGAALDSVADSVKGA